MSEFLLLLVYVDQSPCATSANLFDSSPSMRAGIRFVGFDRASETALLKSFCFVDVLHSCPLALAMISRA